MKKIIEEALNVLLWILAFPLLILLSPYYYYKEMRGFNQRLFYLITFGRPIIGGLMNGKLRISTRSHTELLYQTENFYYERTKNFVWHFVDDNKKNISTLFKMRVYGYWVDEEGYLFIKVYHNQKLIDRFKKEYTKGVDVQ